MAIVCAYLGSVTWPYLDPIGAILVSIYILVSWIRTGMQQTSILTGRAASADYLNRILAIAIDHDPRIRYSTLSIVCVDCIRVATSYEWPQVTLEARKTKNEIV